MRRGRRGWAAPLGIGLLALAVRALVAARTSVIFEDGPYFLEIARAFSEGRYADALAHPYHPLYSALIALVQPLFGDFELAALVVSTLGGAVAAAACFVLLREAFDVQSAWVGSLLYAVSPYPVRFSADVASEGVYVASFTLGLAALYSGVRSRGRTSVLAAGVASGVAYLSRPEGAGLLLIGLAWFAIEWARGERSLREWLRDSFSLCAGGLALIVPYATWLSRQGGDLALSGKKSVLQLLGVAGLNPGAGWGLALAVASCAAGWFIVRSWPRRHMGARRAFMLFAFAICTLVIASPQTARTFGAVVVSTVRPEVTLLVAIGLFASWRNGWREREAFFALVFAAYAVLLVGLLVNYGYLSRRHFVALVPLFLGHAGLGLSASARVAAAALKDARWASPRSVAVGLLVALVAIALPKTLRDHRSEALPERLAAEWIAEHELRSGWVASNKRRTGYYARRRWQPLESAGALRALDELERVKVRYIVAGPNWPARSIESAPGSELGLRELHRVEAGGRSAAVFEIVRSDTFARK